MAPAERFGALILMTAPIIALITRVPGPGLLMFFGGLLTLGLGAVVHLITLPTELNASFGRALPMLEEGNILKEGDESLCKASIDCCGLHLCGSIFNEFD